MIFFLCDVESTFHFWLSVVKANSSLKVKERIIILTGLLYPIVTKEPLMHKITLKSDP